MEREERLKLKAAKERERRKLLGEELCAKERARHHANKEAKNAARRALRLKNLEEAREKDRARRAGNIEEYKARGRLRYQRRKAYVVARNKNRAEAVRRATPSWVKRSDIQEVYDLARDCSVTSGQEYHVDHIVPLVAPNVCGLHVPWNLQVLPQDVNDSKGNKYEGGWE